MALWFCLFCALLLPLVKSQRFKTTTPNEFVGSTLTCTDTECDIICSTSAGCKGATIDASQSQVLRVICNYMQSCQYITITSAAQTSTQINCTAPDSCNGAQLNVANSASSSINCNATVSACPNANINAIDSNTLDVQCYGVYACLGLTLYCPMNASATCNIDCDSSSIDIYPCQSMNVFTPNTQSMDMDCGDLYLQTCRFTDIYCGTNTFAPHSMLQHMTEDQGWGCSAGAALHDECCPFYVATITCNEQPETCVIDCTNTDCRNHIIDASEASGSLTVHCQMSNSGLGGCGGTIINCPNTSDCSVQCSGELDSCRATTIRGTHVNELTVTCESCNILIIWATYAQDITIYSQSLHSCNIYANHANTLNVLCDGIESCTSVDLHADNTHSITLNASKARAFEHSKLYAQNATSVSINCASKYYKYTDYSGASKYYSHDSACFQGDWYLPDHGAQTQLNCYAYGCYSFGAIYVNNSVSSLRLNMNGCSACEPLPNCTNTNTWMISINCQPTVTYYLHSVALLDCVNGSSHCGCDAFTNEVSISNHQNDPKCMFDPTAAPTSITGIPTPVASVPTMSPFAATSMAAMHASFLSSITVLVFLFCVM
eukprot:34718_1